MAGEHPRKLKQNGSAGPRARWYFFTFLFESRTDDCNIHGRGYRATLLESFTPSAYRSPWGRTGGPSGEFPSVRSL
jgi:hypothetical protein